NQRTRARGQLRIDDLRDPLDEAGVAVVPWLSVDSGYEIGQPKLFRLSREHRRQRLFEFCADALAAMRLEHACPSSPRELVPEVLVADQVGHVCSEAGRVIGDQDMLARLDPKAFDPD